MKVIVYFELAGKREMEMPYEDFMQIFTSGFCKTSPDAEKGEKVEKIALFSDKPNRPNKIIHFS